MLNLDQFFSFNFFAYLGRLKRPWLKPEPVKIDYSEIAFNLAQSSALDDSFRSILSHPKITAHCQQAFPNFHHLFVLMPGAGDKYILYGADHFRQYLPEQNILDLLKTHTSAEYEHPFIENIKELSFLFCPIKHENTHATTYLVFSYQGKVPDPTEVDSLTDPLIQAIQRGLQAFLNKQSALNNAIEQERISQAADLHDSIAQVLSYLKLRSSSLKAFLYEPNADSDSTALNLINEIDNQVGFAHRLTRELITSSRLSFLQSELSEAIHHSMEEFEQLSGVVFELDNRAKQGLESLPYKNETLFIIRESLCNLVRHSHASHARIVITQQPNQVQVIIEDNGIGIQPDSQRPDSYGLCIMEERARKMNAKLFIENREQGGTCVQLNIPSDPKT